MRSLHDEHPVGPDRHPPRQRLATIPAIAPVSLMLGALAVEARQQSGVSRLTKLRVAYRKGGVDEVVRRTRIKLARAIYPGELVLATPSRKKPVGKKGPSTPTAAVTDVGKPAQLSAVDVTHDQAMAFFERRRPTYERLITWVAPYIQADDLVLDIGGNIGFFSLVLGELTDLRGTVHLYEPVPHLSELCAVTLRDAPFRAVVHPYGLAESSTRTHIYLAADGNLGWNTLVAERARGMVEVEIEIRRFDPTSIEKPPSFVKIDVEGAEHRVLEGLEEALRSWSPRPVILCEIGWGSGHPHWDEELPVLRRLVDDLGYRPLGEDGAEIDLAAINRTTDVLFVPADRVQH